MFKWTDDLVREFAWIYTGSKDYYDYCNLNTIDKKMAHFKKRREYNGKKI